MFPGCYLFYTKIFFKANWQRPSCAFRASGDKKNETKPLLTHIHDPAKECLAVFTFRGKTCTTQCQGPVSLQIMHLLWSSVVDEISPCTSANHPPV